MPSSRPPSGLDDWVELTKPRITFMVVVTAGFGVLLAARTVPPWSLLAHALLGTWLIAAGSAAINHVLEREVDARMVRTRMRPLPTGRLTPRAASLFGALLAGLGGLELALWVNAPTALLGLVAFVAYVGVYTPLKRRTALATLVGAIPGAIPPMMGWTAVTGRLDFGAWSLFVLLFLWQLPHFLAIAWMCREDYGQAGFPMLPVVHPDGRSTARQMVLYSAALIPASLAPSALGLAGVPYFFGALLLGVFFLAACLRFSRSISERAARRVLLASVVYLPGVLAAMVIDRAF
jgi:protoheme IX farnesyltransferase